jgi:hypothetical protein
MESGRPLAKCEQHGLHYDPNVHAGCVVCRRSDSLPPKGPVSRNPPAPSVPAGGPASFQFTPAPRVVEETPRLMPIVRLLLAGGVLFLVGRLASRYSFSTRQAISDVTSLVMGAVVLAILPMAFRRNRSLAAFSWLLLVMSTLLLVSSARELTQPQPEKEVEQWQMTPQSSRDGLVTLELPATWVARPMEKDTDLSLVSMRGSFAIVETHERASDLPITLDADGYLNAVKKIYAERHSATFGATEAVSSVGGFRGLKVPVDCKLGDIPARGFLLVTRSAAHFHKFLVVTEPGYAEHLAAPLRWVEQGRIVNGA